MKSIANKSSFGAQAMSGTSVDVCAWSATARLLLTRPHISAPGVSGKRRSRR
jgi:hypothetical protein